MPACDFSTPNFCNMFQQQQMLTFFPQSAFERSSNTGCFRSLWAKRRMQLCSTLAQWRGEHRWLLPCVVPVRSWGIWVVGFCQLGVRVTSTKFLQVLLAAAELSSTEAFPAVYFKPNELVFICKFLCVLHCSLFKNVGFNA